METHHESIRGIIASANVGIHEDELAGYEGGCVGTDGGDAAEARSADYERRGE